MPDDPLTLDSKIQRNPSVIVSELDGEKVMLSVESGFYYGLAATAGRIWELIEQPRSISEICEALIEEFAVDRTTCEQHVLEFLGELRKEGIVQRV